MLERLDAYIWSHIYSKADTTKVPSREKFAAIVLEVTLLIIIVCRLEMKAAERYGTFILPVVLHIDLPVRLRLPCTFRGVPGQKNVARPD